MCCTRIPCFIWSCGRFTVNLLRHTSSPPSAEIQLYCNAPDEYLKCEVLWCLRNTPEGILKVSEGQPSELKVSFRPQKTDQDYLIWIKSKHFFFYKHFWKSSNQITALKSRANLLGVIWFRQTGQGFWICFRNRSSNSILILNEVRSYLLGTICLQVTFRYSFLIGSWKGP